MQKYGILFVCTGNICRSPTAEGVFRARAGENGLLERLTIDSAGTHGYHVGEPPDSRAIAAALARGVQMDDLRARRLSSQDFHDFDLILAMDTGHHSHMLAMTPNESRAQTALFLDYAPETGLQDVPDPYYGGAQGFEEVLDLVDAGVEGLLAHVRKELAT